MGKFSSSQRWGHSHCWLLCWPTPQARHWAPTGDCDCHNSSLYSLLGKGKSSAQLNLTCPHRSLVLHHNSSIANYCVRFFQTWMRWMVECFQDRFQINSWRFHRSKNVCFGKLVWMLEIWNICIFFNQTVKMYRYRCFPFIFAGTDNRHMNASIVCLYSSILSWKEMIKVNLQHTQS